MTQFDNEYTTLVKKLIHARHEIITEIHEKELKIKKNYQYAKFSLTPSNKSDAQKLRYKLTKLKPTQPRHTTIKQIH